eukprot:4093898-Pleurochrysis_carterae.AAC.1
MCVCTTASAASPARRACRSERASAARCSRRSGLGQTKKTPMSETRETRLPAGRSEPAYQHDALQIRATTWSGCRGVDEGCGESKAANVKKASVHKSADPDSTAKIQTKDALPLWMHSTASTG